ncbi:hypothetical protein G173_gp183 [Erwinia phage phiEaH2]|uniref:Uncharacterized protein n=1 Tax=Erwinia phage phiEaH2 TaxID=1029988 RepID=J7KHL9_9CAUD|nr:hypothetical protein G173_gp183 [Erwinia phage phiEaH2]AFQ96728.1 hypothetical protein [Erwinia phage phiEaH2]
MFGKKCFATLRTGGSERGNFEPPTHSGIGFLQSAFGRDA